MSPPAPRHYTNPHRFTPRTYRDECEEAGRPVPPAVRCPCGRVVDPLLVVDVRGLPAAVTGGQEWACDGCWTRWLRAGACDLVDWLGWHGAPAALIQRHARRPNPYGAPDGPPRDLARRPSPPALRRDLVAQRGANS